MTVAQPAGLQGWPETGEGRTDAPRDRFRANLSRIMAERGITQAALARTMGVSRVAVHAWIWGTCFPETSRLLKLAQALDVQIGTLMEGGAGSAAKAGSSSDEAMLLDAFRKLPKTARMTVLADVFELSAQLSAITPAASATVEIAS